MIFGSHYSFRYLLIFAYTWFLFYPFKMIFPKTVKIILLLAALVPPPQLAAAHENKSIETAVFNKASWADLTFTGSKFLLPSMLIFT